MTSFLKLAENLLGDREVTSPVTMSKEESRRKVLAAIMRELIMQAVSCGVRPSYVDWLGMEPAERAVWEEICLEVYKAETVRLATACGNVGMAKRALHDGNEAALDLDAIEAGLQAAGVLS